MLLYIQIWNFINITGHWAHQLASTIRGDKSHKTSQDDKRTNILLRFYYKTKFGLAFIVTMNEVFFVSCYVYKFFEGSSGSGFLWYAIAVSAPFMLLKTVITLAHLGDALWSLAEIECKGTMGNEV